MRVTHRVPFFPDAIRLDELQDYVADDNVEEEPITEAFNNIAFRYIYPGVERVCIILRSQGIGYAEIAWILGVNVAKVHNTIYKVRNRLIKADIKKYLVKPILQNGSIRNNLTTNI